MALAVQACTVEEREVAMAVVQAWAAAMAVVQAWPAEVQDTVLEMVVAASVPDLERTAPLAVSVVEEEEAPAPAACPTLGAGRESMYRRLTTNTWGAEGTSARFGPGEIPRASSRAAVSRVSCCCSPCSVCCCRGWGLQPPLTVEPDSWSGRFRGPRRNRNTAV